MRSSILIIFSSFILFEFVTTDVTVYLRKSGYIMEEFRSLPTQFEPFFPESGARFLLVAGNPRNGCDTMDRPPTNDNNSTKFAVLLARYNCTFEAKIRNAQSAGFGAVILYNVASNELEKISVQSSAGINIPTTFVSEQTGKILVESYDDYQLYGIILNNDLPYPKQHITVV